MVVLQAISQTSVHSDVGGAPVWVAPQTIDYWLKRLRFERRAESFIKRAELEGILREPVLSVFFR